MTRRQFTRLLLGGAGAGLLAGCSPAGPGGSESTSGSGLGGLLPAPVPTRAVLKNLDRPGFYVRYFKAFRAVDPDAWTLEVEGLVENPIQLTLQEMRDLPSITQASRLRCVEGWSAAAKWGGFRFSALAGMVKPLPEATWVHFFCADSYYECLSVEELQANRVLFAHSMNGDYLSDEHGFPLRMVVPDKYGYKGAKAIERLVFADHETTGLWSRIGPYSTGGEILAGSDLPLDLGGSRQIEGGEIRYPDGLEAAG